MAAATCFIPRHGLRGLELSSATPKFKLCMHFAQSNSKGCVALPVAHSRRNPENKQAVQLLLRALTEEATVVVDVLERRGQALGPQDWFVVMQALADWNLWQPSIEVFRWIQMQKWYRHDLGFYSKFISIMGKADKVKSATWLFGEMKRSGLKPDTSAFNALITAQVRNRKNPRGWETGLRILEDMQRASYAQPNIVTYNILIRACGLAGEFDVVNELFVEVRKAGLVPDEYTFNGILDAYGKAGHMVQMEQMMVLMEAEYCKPGLITFNILIDVYGKSGWLDEMERLFRRMRAIRMSPNLRTFHSMMSAYGKAGQLDKMEALFLFMNEANVVLSFVTYEIRIRAYRQAARIDKMEDCLAAMMKAGMKLMPSTFTVMLEAYCEHGCGDRAEKLLMDAPQMGFYPDVKYYGSVMKAFGKAGQIQGVDRLLKRMDTAEVQPDESTFLDMLEVYTMSSSR